MTREEIIAAIRKNADAIKAEGVTNLAIFGSRVRGDNRPDSDIDVLIEVEPDTSFSLLNLIDVEHIGAPRATMTGRNDWRPPQPFPHTHSK